MAARGPSVRRPSCKAIPGPPKESPPLIERHALTGARARDRVARQTPSGNGLDCDLRDVWRPVVARSVRGAAAGDACAGTGKYVYTKVTRIEGGSWVHPRLGSGL